jgi:hypothetical protein
MKVSMETKQRGRFMYGSHVVIHAAANQKRKKEFEEEEDMTRYSQSDLDKDWEFKIVRSTFGAFSKPQVLNSLIEEEAQAGWEMVEKFDEYRVRFKRPSSSRKNDAMLPDYVDPYRTQFGAFGRQKAVVIGLIIGLVLLLAGLGMYLFLTF